MDLAWISLAALLVVIVVSCTTTLNAGYVAVVLAWVIGVYVAPAYGKQIGVKGVLAGFPEDLFLTLVGVTLLFTLAQTNGTLDRVARRGVRSCRGNAGLVPVMFFFLAFGLASIGPGNIAAAALIAPMAMAVAQQAGISAFLMTLMVAHGAVAGALSPLAPTGLIARDRMADIGLVGFGVQTYLYNLLANSVVAFAGYFAFGGWRLFGRRFVESEGASHDRQTSPSPPARRDSEALHPSPPAAGGEGPGVRGAVLIGSEGSHTFQTHHHLTLSTIAVLVVAVIGCKVGLGRELHVGMAAFVAAIVLILFRIGDEKEAIRTMPWGVIIMVCGVTVLTSLLEQTGGMDRMSDLVARVSNSRSVTGVIALVAGLVSVYSSTSGVVLPAFLPMTRGLVERLLGSDALAIASSINVGGHLVDVSPLSTIGALCVASASAAIDRRKLFNQVLAWGLSMSVVGAVFCYVFFGLL
jgi:Na+/H+ antiporter NhaD/arsenite permease-like protein